jgi:hypothetical protein
MDDLGGYRELAPSTRWLGNLVFLGVLVITAFLERLQFQLRTVEGSSWWASNGRDVVNAFALASMALGLHFVGFTGPVALSIAAAGIILMTALQTALGERAHWAAYSLTTAFALGLPVLLVPRWVDQVFRGLLTFLFPR